MAFYPNAPNVLIQYVPVHIQHQTSDKEVSCVVEVDHKDVQTHQITDFKSSFLKDIDAHLRVNFAKLQTRVLVWGEEEACEITRIKSDIPPSKGGPMTMARVVIDITGMAKFTVAGELLQQCSLIDQGNLDVKGLEHILENLADEFVFCAGISRTEFKEVCTNIPYEPTLVNFRQHPFERYISKKCKHWSKLRFNATRIERESVQDGSFRCMACNEAYRELRKLNKNQSANLDADVRQKREQADSHYPIKFLSQQSKKRRLANQNLAKKRDQAQIQRFKKKLAMYDVELCEEDNRQLAEFVETVTEEDLDKVLKDQSCADTDEQQDAMAALKAAFFEDQTKNRNGQHGNRWSMATYRICLSIYSQSPAAYNSLRNWGIFNLPSKNALQEYSTTLLHGPGPYFDYLRDQAMRYEKFTQEAQQKGLKKPLGEGVLILDEVKVVGKVAWNSKNGKLCGIQMHSNDMPFLADLKQELNGDEGRDPAEYFLQFLWRDLTSKYDVIGPHYTSAKTMDSQFTHACLMETLTVFQNYNFKVRAMVMDGASSNLAMIKLLSGHGKGAYGVSAGEDRHAVQPWFVNPHFPAEKIYMIICPSHQMKNMINQLWASRPGGAKSFSSVEGIDFGWKAVMDMWEREKERRDNNHIRKVPGLVKAYIDRDPWTKLNVKPAKIMQQDAALGELYSHANPDNQRKPRDAAHVNATHDFLKAVHLMFERGMLMSQGRESQIRSLDSAVMTNIEEGFSYFKTWCDHMLDEVEDFHLISPKERRFIAWQTYDLLRVMKYGFLGFVEDFLADHPDYYIVAMKLNGSAVETLFAQFKQRAGGKLTSLNYETAKKSVLLKRDVFGKHPSGAGYRDVALDIQELPLLRKKSSKCNLSGDR